MVAQTRQAQADILSLMTNRAAVLGLGFFLITALLSILTARSVVAPVLNLAEAVARRGPQDLRPVARQVPTELGPFVAALNGFMGRLSGALSRTETFITEAAHHIRTPLAALRAQAEIALRQTQEEEVRSTLRGMIRAVDSSARSAGQLLDHAAVVYRSDQRTEQELDLNALLTGLCRDFDAVADMRDIGLDLGLPDAPLRLVADRLLLESAVRNLIDNAVKYSAAESRIDIRAAQQADRILISVCDRGRGLSGEKPADLVGRFRRGRNSGDVVGSGLGLTIVREAALALGGSFTLSEREGGGACAVLSLPLS
jgi:two-component system sensor histidine kinase TctE